MGGYVKPFKVTVFMVKNIGLPHFTQPLPHFYRLSPISKADFGISLTIK
jgi:hypothetical protein